MARTLFAGALAATLVALPVHADDKVLDIVGGIARDYIQMEQDRATFSQAQSTNTLAAYQSYLKQFPKGIYADHARQQIERLTPKKSTATQPARTNSGTQGSAASLSAAERYEVQRRLNNLGYETNGTDGNFGPGTRRAISLWQRDRNYVQTGTLTAAEANEILQGRTTANKGTAAPDNGPATQEAALNLTRQQRAEIQAGLTRRGFDTRGADGVFGARTRDAIAGWQRANDHSVTGYLTEKQAARLRE